MQHLTLINNEWKQGQETASEQDAAQAQALYEQHRIEGADLIDVNINLPLNTGIINCRIDGEHKQIRF
jgi:hypothetical protein